MALWKKALRVLRWLVVLFFASSILSVLVLKWCPVYVTPLMVIRCFQQIGRGEQIRLLHHWTPLADISPYLAEAVMCTEDSRFLQHHGFDFKEINRALADREKGKRRRGASTISQQTAKNVFLGPRSTWVRKAFEAYFTVLIEFIWGKARIMEVYLNSIEMGDGLYGAEATAQHNFGTNAKGLTRLNCALIALSLPNPLVMNSARPSAYMLRRQPKVVSDMQWAERTQGLGDLGIFNKGR